MKANCDRKPLSLNDKALAYMDGFTYLGSVKSNDVDCSIDNKNIFGKAWGAFKKLKKLEFKRPK